MMTQQRPSGAVALIEIGHLSPAIVAIDRMTKSTHVELRHYELNDLLGICICLTGSTASLQHAGEIAKSVVEPMGVSCTVSLLANPHDDAAPAIFSEPEWQGLLEQPAVFFPKLVASEHPSRSPKPNRSQKKESATMAESKPAAIGMIETQGFVAILDAIDAACKAANVSVIGKEKLGGGFITVLIEGDVAAVQSAIDAGCARVEQLGTLIAAHVISRPSDGVLALLPELAATTRK